MSTPSPSFDTDTVEGRIAYAAHHLAQVSARREARDRARDLVPRRTRRQTGASIVFSVRLDRAEVAALEERAALADLKPTVLARNLIRMGLAGHRGAEVADAVDRLDAMVQELRAALTG